MVENDCSVFRNFVPLRNFTEGQREYENTCFIAAAVNLSAWIPAIAEELAILSQGNHDWDERRWQELIADVT